MNLFKTGQEGIKLVNGVNVIDLWLPLPRIAGRPAKRLFAPYGVKWFKKSTGPSLK